MPQNKTRPETTIVAAFLDAVTPPRRQADARVLCTLFQEVSGEAPVMWGSSIVGFGSYHYRYDSGREGDMFLVGFSPRKHALTVYIMDGFEQHAENLAKLGPNTLGKACLYLKSLRDIDLGVLVAIVGQSIPRIGKQRTEGAGENLSSAVASRESAM